MSDTTTETDETAALPGDGLREGIVDALRSDLGEHLIDTYLIPQTDAGQMKWVEAILAESYSAASAEDAAPSATDPLNRSSCLP